LNANTVNLDMEILMQKQTQDDAERKEREKKEFVKSIKQEAAELMKEMFPSPSTAVSILAEILDDKRGFPYKAAKAAIKHLSMASLLPSNRNNEIC